jgi:hypothetical protein
LPAGQGLPENNRASHSQPRLRGETGAIERGPCDFAENVGLGEFLGADYDWLGRHGRRREQANE